MIDLKKETHDVSKIWKMSYSILYALLYALPSLFIAIPTTYIYKQYVVWRILCSWVGSIWLHCNRKTLVNHHSLIAHRHSSSPTHTVAAHCHPYYSSRQFYMITGFHVYPAVPLSRLLTSPRTNFQASPKNNINNVFRERKNHTLYSPDEISPMIQHHLLLLPMMMMLLHYNTYSQ